MKSPENLKEWKELFEGIKFSNYLYNVLLDKQKLSIHAMYVLDKLS